MKARRTMKVPTLTALVGALVLAGCATAPAPLPQPLTAAPAAFHDTGAAGTAAAATADGRWWQAFGDPALDALIERAEHQNTTLQVAAARVLQARALLRASDAARLPQVGVAAGASRGTTLGQGPAVSNLFSVGADLSYEVDLFGRLAGASNAAALDLAARESLQQSTRLVVQAQVAQAYFTLRALDDEHRIVQETVQAYHGTLSLSQRRLAAGDIAELDVERLKSEVAATESEALALERQRAQVEHALALLTGESATGFDLQAAPWTSALPVVPAGLPSSVLARRPDVAAAQASLQAAQVRLGVAKAAWFPTLSLTASGGSASPELSDLFRGPARAWSLGALLAAPLFDGGRRSAGVDNARGELDAAFAGYREQVLVALKDVEDELSALRLLAAQQQAQAAAVDAAARATTLSATRWRNGLVSQLELLDAQRSELRNRRQALQVRAAQYQATVALIRALGGGWG